jgi:hypothetical protein
MLDNSGTINLTAVNIAGINSGFNKNLVDGVTNNLLVINAWR